MAPLCRESLSSTVLQLNPKALIYLEWVWDWVACLWSNWKLFNYILWLNHSWVLAIRYQTGNRVIRKLQDVSMGGFTSPAQPGQLCLQPPPPIGSGVRLGSPSSRRNPFSLLTGLRSRAQSPGFWQEEQPWFLLGTWRQAELGVAGALLRWKNHLRLHAIDWQLVCFAYGRDWKPQCMAAGPHGVRLLQQSWHGCPRIVLGLAEV